MVFTDHTLGVGYNICSCYNYLFSTFTFSLETWTYAVCARSQQTSSNGSFTASLGCDDNTNTFSLTNDGVNQSWSLELDDIYTIDWIFISIGAGMKHFCLLKCHLIYLYHLAFSIDGTSSPERYLHYLRRINWESA